MEPPDLPAEEAERRRAAGEVTMPCAYWAALYGRPLTPKAATALLRWLATHRPDAADLLISALEDEGGWEFRSTDGTPALPALYEGDRWAYQEAWHVAIARVHGWGDQHRNDLRDGLLMLFGRHPVEQLLLPIEAD